MDNVMARSRLEENDVLVIIAGATTGAASVLDRSLLPANTNQAVSFVRPKNTIYSVYIFYWLSTSFAQSSIWCGAVQSAQPNLSMENLGNIPILVPPEAELSIILGHLEKVILKIDLVGKSVKKQIRILSERRTALISATVTGKIDVRNWQPHKATSTPSTDA